MCVCVCVSLRVSVCACVCVCECKHLLNFHNVFHEIDSVKRKETVILFPVVMIATDFRKFRRDTGMKNNTSNEMINLF